jgi:pimeloyl-ACP methyl ester carboxylesterase
MSEPESRFYHSNRLRLHYLVWGDESKPPLILVHGSRDHGRSWDFVAERLIDRYCAYVPDLRGHGDSDWPIGGGYQYSEFVADLARLVEAIGRGPVRVVGHSLGGRVVLDYAAAFPEGAVKVISIEGFGFGPPMISPRDRLRNYVMDLGELERREPHAYDSLEDAAGRMQQANRRLRPAMVQHLTKHAVRRREDGKYVWKFDDHFRLRPAGEWTDEEAKAIWSEIRAPVLMVGGSDNWGRLGTRREMLDALRDVTIEVVEDAGHWVHHDQLERFVVLVKEFFTA